MVNIVNPEAIKFVNEQVRPLCEKARALVAEIQAMQSPWYGGLNLVIMNTADDIADGRDAEGVSRLKGSDVNSAVGILLAIVAASNAEIIAKPCVHPLIAQ